MDQPEPETVNDPKLEEQILATKLRAEGGDINAQVEMGRYYLGANLGEIGEKLAFDFFESAANAGNSHGQVNLGYMYFFLFILVLAHFLKGTTKVLELNRTLKKPLNFINLQLNKRMLEPTVILDISTLLAKVPDF